VFYKVLRLVRPLPLAFAIGLVLVFRSEVRHKSYPLMLVHVIVIIVLRGIVSLARLYHLCLWCDHYYILVETIPTTFRHETRQWRQHGASRRGHNRSTTYVWRRSDAIHEVIWLEGLTLCEHSLLWGSNKYRGKACTLHKNTCISVGVYIPITLQDSIFILCYFGHMLYWKGNRV
jgi:hypothetical protein